MGMFGPSASDKVKTPGIPKIKKIPVGRPKGQTSKFSWKAVKQIGATTKPQDKGRIKQKIKRTVEVGKRAGTQQQLGAHAFPGVYNGPKTEYRGKKGLFVQSIKGMKGKHYIETAFDMTLAEFTKNG